MAEQPTIRPFKYLFVSANDSIPLEEKHFDGTSEDDLKRVIVGHFNANKMSNGQRVDMANHLYAKSKSNVPNDTTKSKGGKDDDGDNEATPNPSENNNNNNNTEADRDQMAGLLATAVEKSSYEIVPVVMPMRANKFIGTSLYIDDAGRFKDLPLNGRASRLAQKDIRGDAFLLSNHDDPALDTWGRVDCTAETFETIAKNPKPTLDTSNQMAMAQATALRESDAKTISTENAAGGLKSKADGNAFFAKGDLKAAVQAYSACIEMTDGRADLLSNGDEITAARVASFLNRSLCYGRLGDWASAEKDAMKVVFAIDGGNVKGWFRLATARSYQKDFDGAEEALRCLEQVDSANTAAGDVAQLRTDMIAARAKLEASEKKKYAKMFA